MKYLNLVLYILPILLFSCKIDRGTIDVVFKKSNVSTLAGTSIASVSIFNNQLIIKGTNLSVVTDVQVQNENLGFTKSFIIESKSNTQIVANGNSTISFMVHTAFDLILKNSQASAMFTIDFSICNAKLNNKAFDCTVVAQDKDVLSYDAATQTWRPRAVNGLNYLGAFDASTGIAPALKPTGSYYVVSVAGTISTVHFEVGDWIVSNGTGYQKIGNSSSIASVFGRSGTIVATEGDYSLDKLSDVDLQVVAPSNGKILKFNGTTNKWEVGDDLSGGGASSVTSAEIQDGTITGVDIANDTVTLAKLNGTSDATKYLRGDKTWATFLTDVLNVPLTGYTLNAGAKPSVVATDKITDAFGKVQKYLDDLNTDYVSKTATSQSITGSWSFTNPTSFLYTQTPSGISSTEVANVDYVKTFVNSVWTSGTGAQAGNLYRASGNIGIGTNTPNTSLDINGAISIRGMAAPANSVAGQGRIYFDSTVNKFKISENNGAYFDLLNPWSSGSGLLYVDNTKVGIDTNSPDAQFSLGNKAYSQPSSKTYSNSDEANFWFYESQNYPTSNYYGRILDIMAGGGNKGGLIRFLTQPASSAAVERMVINDSGNIGIGISTPFYKLHVAGNAIASQYYAGTGMTAAYPNPRFAVEHSGDDYGGNYNGVKAGGDLTAPFHSAVKDNSTSPDRYAYMAISKPNSDFINNTSAHSNGHFLAGIGFAGQTNSTAGLGMKIGASIIPQVDNTVSSGVLPTALTFRTSPTDSTGLVERMRISSTGNIGIGVFAPGEKLDVGGNIKASGQIYSGVQASSATSPLTYNANLGNTMVWTINDSTPVVNIHNMKAGGKYTFVVKGSGTGAVAINCYSDAGSTVLSSSFQPTNGARTSGTLNKTVYSIISDGTDCLISWVTGF